MTCWLKCRIAPGQFSNEFSVVAKSFDGNEFSLFAQRESVDVSREEFRDQPIEGKLRVELLRREGNNALIRLPHESFEAGLWPTVAIADISYPTIPSFAG